VQVNTGKSLSFAIAVLVCLFVCLFVIV
jgi:hypothetical protein